MRGKRAKAIRKLVYGDDYSPKFRDYSRIGESKWKKIKNVVGKVFTGETTLADQKRGEYQRAKRYWKQYRKRS